MVNIMVVAVNAGLSVEPISFDMAGYLWRNMNRALIIRMEVSVETFIFYI
jgi:hypothetical protein